MRFLRQSTACTIPVGPLVDATDGATLETGLTISQADIILSKNGGAVAQKAESSNSAHSASGIYLAALNATDTGTIGRLVIACIDTAARPWREEYFVLPPDLYDLMTAANNSADGQANILKRLKSFMDSKLFTPA